MNKGTRFLLAACLVALTSGAAMAHHVCAYANDNINGSLMGDPNTVDGYKFGLGGPTIYLKPVATNGQGTGGGFYLSGMGAAWISGKALYAEDALTNDITHFQIDLGSCHLSIDHTNYPSGDTAVGMGDGLAVTPNGRFLYVGSTGDNNIYLHSIESHGFLGLPASVATTPDTPNGIAVSPDGQTLVVAYPNIQQVCAYPIQTNGALGPSNCQTTSGFPAAITIDPSSTCVYAGEANGSASEVAALALTPGTLGTPADYILGTGVNSSAVLGSSNNTHLFITNQGSAQITTASISRGCSLSWGAGNIIDDGSSTDSPGQIAQGGNLPFIVTGDYSSAMTPQMGILRIAGSRLGRYKIGPYPLTQQPGNAPFSVVAVED
jgi:WD40 repeat protein